MKEKMVKVSVEVRSGTARFRVGVQAQSIKRALSMVGTRHPQGEVRFGFLIEPEGLFIEESSTLTGKVGPELTSTKAA